MVYRDALSDSLVFTADVSGTGLLVDSHSLSFKSTALIYMGSTMKQLETLNELIFYIPDISRLSGVQTLVKHRTLVIIS